MCEGTFNWKGHRRFAEAWLTRIEHEIAGRNRRQFYAASVPTELGRLEAGPAPTRAAEEAGPIRGVYAPSTNEGFGIGRAPRHGAGGVAQAPKPEDVVKDMRKGRQPKSSKQRPTTPSSTRSSRFGNYVRSPSLGRHKANRLSSPQQQQRDGESGASSVPGSVDGDGSTRSRSGSFSRPGSVLPDGTFHDESAPAVPPLPPTYENVDESAQLDQLNPPTGIPSSTDESDNGKDTLSPRWGHDSTWGTNSSASVSTAETSASSPRRSDSEQRAATPATAPHEKGVRNGKSTLPPLPSVSSVPSVPPVPKRSARRPSASQIHSRMDASLPQLPTSASFADSMRETSLPQLPASASFADSMRDEVARHYTDKDRDVAYDVPVNATDDTEEFVTLNEGGLMEVQPPTKSRPGASESSLASTLHAADAPATPSASTTEEHVNGLGIQSLRLKDEDNSGRNGSISGQLYPSSSNGSVDDFGRRARKPSTNPSSESGDEAKRLSIGSARSARGLPFQSPAPTYAPPPTPGPGSSAIPVSASPSAGKWQKGSGWQNSDPFGARNTNVGTLSPPYLGSSPDSYDSHSRKGSIMTQSSQSQGSHSRRPSGSRAPEREGNVMFDAEAFGKVNLL